MPPNKESQEIASLFSQFSKNGDKSLIQDIPEDKLKLALIQYAADKHFPHYSAMEMRLSELREERASNYSMAEKDKIFISHSVNDKKIADAFIDLLDTGIGVDIKAIFCSSVEGAGIEKGDDFVKVICKEIVESKLVILLLSPNYFASIFCIAELGASWVLNKKIFPIILPPLTYEDIKHVLTGKEVGKINMDSDLADLKDVVIRELSIASGSTARWEAKRNQFRTELPALLSALPMPTKVDPKKFEEISKKYEDSLKEIQKSQEETAKLKAVIEQLKKCKNSAESSQILMDASDSWKLFEDILERLNTQLKKFSDVVKEAFYYHFAGKLYCPDYEEYRLREQVQWAEENGFVQMEGNTVSLNQDDVLIAKTLTLLEELAIFLEKMRDKPFTTEYIEKYEYRPDLKNRRFWSNHIR